MSRANRFTMFRLTVTSSTGIRISSPPIVGVPIFEACTSAISTRTFLPTP